jgi:UDP:flavonoid glycosyltransferase YjiC (YdhE family)
MTGFPGPATCSRRCRSFPRSIRRCCPCIPRLARADKAVPGMGRASAPRTLVSRKWPQPIYDLRRELGLPRGSNPLFDAKHSPDLVLALFSRVLGQEQPDWPANTRITGFCFYDSDAGNATLAPHLEKFLAAGPPPLVFTLGSAAVLAAGRFYEYGARAAERLGMRAVLLIGSDPRNRPRQSALRLHLRRRIRALFGFFSQGLRRSFTREEWAPRRSVCGQANPC